MYPPAPTDDPNNDRAYDLTSLGTWSSLSDTETFLSHYNHNSNYYYDGTSLACGNRITIQDGTYNVEWMIAGFDVESNRTASDGTTYDNGYGIALVPVTHVTTGQWYSSWSTSGGYKSSYIHTTTLPTVATKLKNVLGSHLISRNVLLSSSIDSSANAYVWTTAYATLMSVGQMTGTFASNYNKYDDGEANYKLPVFDKTSYVTGSAFWTRGIYDPYAGWIVYIDGRISYNYTSGSSGVRPLIYIR